MNPATRGIRIMIMAVVTALSLAACGATPYKTYSYWNGGGFTDTEVQPGLFLVRFMGNASTTPARTADLALLRAAEICLDRGKGYLLLGELATQYAQSGYIAGSTTTTTVATGDPNAPPLVSVSTSPPTLLYSPSSGVAVACAEAQGAGAWDAHYLSRSIREKYELS